MMTISMYWLWITYIKCNFISHMQQTINRKDGKMLTLGSEPTSTIAFQGLRFYHCTNGDAVKSWKAMMDMSRDPTEGIYPSLGSSVSWLLAVSL